MLKSNYDISINPRAKGLTRMPIYFANRIYKTKDILKFVNRLVSEYHYKSFRELTFEDQCELAGLLVNVHIQSGSHEPIVESDQLDILMHFLSEALRNSNQENNSMLALMFKRHIVDYHFKTMETLFDEALEDYENNSRNPNDEYCADTDLLYSYSNI
jgi:hypothetical protein